MEISFQIFPCDAEDFLRPSARAAGAWLMVKEFGSSIAELQRGWNTRQGNSRGVRED
jgi:hypothetical protein